MGEGGGGGGSLPAIPAPVIPAMEQLVSLMAALPDVWLCRVRDGTVWPGVAFRYLVRQEV